MDSSPTAAFGGLPEIDLHPWGLEPVHALRVEWPWLRPLRAILAFCGHTIDDVVSDPRAATEVRILWKVHALSLRLAAERAALDRRAEDE